MSKKKQPPKMPAKTEEPVKAQPEKKSVKGIIIVVAAIVLAVAIILTVVFIVKPGSDDSNITTTATDNAVITNPGTGKYTYADYKGASMPKEFVDILIQADIDREAACKKHGVALEVGDVEISQPEFTSYYYDQYSLQKGEIEYSIQQTGSNRTGYDPEKMPDEQQCLNKGYTWAEDFTLKAIEVIQANYRSFERALEKGITLTDNEIATTISQFEVLELASKFQHRSVAELLEEIYGEGYTESMFKAREIMLAYKEKYEAVSKQELGNAYSEEKLQQELDKDVNAYTVVVGRVYLIEGKFDAVEASKVSTEEEFIAYANANHPNENYSAEIATQCNYLDKKAISETFGDEVADWMFNEERVAGEIAVVQSQLFRYLVYLERTPYLNVSRKIMYFGYDYEEGTSEDEKADYLASLKAKYGSWKEGDASKEAFRQLCIDNSGIEEYDARISDFYYVYENWIFDSARKPGDCEIVESDAGCAAFYYIGENEGDYDWKENMKTDMAEAEFNEISKTDIKKNYEPKRNVKVINKAYKTTNVTIAKRNAAA